MCWAVDEYAFPRDSQELNPVFPSVAMLRYSIQCSQQLSRTLTTTDNKNQVFICLYLKVNSECDLDLRIICASAKTFAFCPSHPWKWQMGSGIWWLTSGASPVQTWVGILLACLLFCVSGMWFNLPILCFHWWNRGSTSPHLIEVQAQIQACVRYLTSAWYRLNVQ